MILSIIAFTKVDNSQYRFVSSLAENWNKGPILKIIPRNGSCRVGEELILADEWPGTVQGCDCSNAFNMFGSSPLSRGSCSTHKGSNEKRYCKDVLPVDPIQFKVWSGKTMCGQRMSLNYLDLKLFPTADKCPSNTRSCGVADTKYNVLCVNSDSPCPINKLLILNIGEQVPTDFKYKQFPLDNGKILAWTTEDYAGEILHEFNISQDTPCLDSGFENTLIEPYVLSRAYDRNGCPKVKDSDLAIDTRVRQLDSEIYNKFVYENGIEKIYNNLPLYQPPPDSVTISLWSKEYYGLAKECKTDIQKLGQGVFLQNLSKFESTVSSTRTWTLVIMITSIIGFILGLGFFIVSFEHSDRDGINVGKMEIIGICVLNLLTLIFASIAATKSNSLSQDYRLLEIDGCSDKITDNIVTAFSNSFGNANRCNLANCFFQIILIAWPVLYFVFGMFDRKKF
jgi:hypothetical protein